VVDSLQLTAFKKVATPANWQVCSPPQDTFLKTFITHILHVYVYVVIQIQTYTTNMRLAQFQGFDQSMLFFVTE